MIWSPCFAPGHPAGGSGSHAARWRAKPPASDNPSFDQLKSLVGNWQGKDQHSNVVHLTFELVSGGSALMERNDSSNGAEMISRYSAEGNRLILTHLG